MELALVSTGKKANKATLNVSEEIFGKDYNEALVHQVVTAYMAASRSGSKAQKNRSAVSGGGAKPFKQKGTGRARAGTIRSPIWVGGGVAFAASPRDYSQKVNKKMFKGAMRSILSELARQERLVIVEDLKLENPKTKELISALKGFDIAQALILVDKWDKNLYLAGRNVPNIEIWQADRISPVKLIKYPHVVITEEAVRKLEEVLA